MVLSVSCWESCTDRTKIAVKRFSLTLQHFLIFIFFLVLFFGGENFLKFLINYFKTFHSFVPVLIRPIRDEKTPMLPPTGANEY